MISDFGHTVYELKTRPHVKYSVVFSPAVPRITALNVRFSFVDIEIGVYG